MLKTLIPYLRSYVSLRLTLAYLTLVSKLVLRLTLGLILLSLILTYSLLRLAVCIIQAIIHSARKLLRILFELDTTAS